MIRYFLIPLMLVLPFTGSYAQDLELDDIPQFRGQAMERIKSMRIAFITNKLALTTEQSQDFWPIYNQYENSQKKIRSKYRRDKNINLMSDGEVEDYLTARLQMDQELLDLKKNYYNQLKAAISIRQIAQISTAEREFKTMILKEWRQRQRQRRRN